MEDYSLQEYSNMTQMFQDIGHTWTSFAILSNTRNNEISQGKPFQALNFQGAFFLVRKFAECHF